MFHFCSWEMSSTYIQHIQHKENNMNQSLCVEPFMMVNKSLQNNLTKWFYTFVIWFWEWREIFHTVSLWLRKTPQQTVPLVYLMNVFSTAQWPLFLRKVYMGLASYPRRQRKCLISTNQGLWTDCFLCDSCLRNQIFLLPQHMAIYKLLQIQAFCS